MRKIKEFFKVTIGLFLLASWMHAAAVDIIIQVRFFKGTWMEDRASILKQVDIMTTTSYPEIIPLKAMVDDPEYEQTAAIIETLVNLMELKTLDDIGLLDMPWDGKKGILRSRFIGKRTGYRFNCTPEWISPQKLALKVAFFKSKEIAHLDGTSRAEEIRRILEVSRKVGLMEKILLHELVIEMDNPVIIGIPYKDQAYFIVTSWTMGKDSKLNAPVGTEKPSQTSALATPKPIHQILPSYPEELRQRGVEGEVQLRILIDKKGIVKSVQVVKSLHPYLDYAAAQALWQWKFKPFLEEGKPIPLESIFTVNFIPKIWRIEEEKAETKGVLRTGMEPTMQAKLQRILEHSAEYCEKLANSALDFICEEKINDIHFNMNTENMIKYQYSYSPEPNIGVTTGFRIMDPKKTERNHFVCDYQIIKKGSDLLERRIILKENGRKIEDKKKLLKNKRFSVLIPVLASIRFLERTRQDLYHYRILKEDKINGKRAYVIEAMPKSLSSNNIQYARIWVNKNSFQILKSEIRGVPLEGYDDVWIESALVNIKPECKITHVYRVDKKGILFPRRSTVLVQYPAFDARGPITKIKTYITYTKYKFFTVETDHNIIKKMSKNE